jgi:hypothetical protein
MPNRAAFSGPFGALCGLRLARLFLLKTLLKLAVVEVNLRGGPVVCTNKIFKEAE